MANRETSVSGFCKAVFLFRPSMHMRDNGDHCELRESHSGGLSKTNDPKLPEIEITSASKFKFVATAQSITPLRIVFWRRALKYGTHFTAHSLDVEPHTHALTQR